MQQNKLQGEDKRGQVLAELRDWAAYTGRALPYPAELIADLETQGWVVDLLDGSIVRAEVVLNQRVTLSAKGRALYAELQAKAQAVTP